MMPGRIVYSWLPAAVALFPMACTGLVYFAGRSSARLRNMVALFASAGTTVLAAAMYPAVSAGNTLVTSFGGFLPPLGISFRVDTLSFFLALLSSSVWFLVTIYSLEYMKDEHGQTRYYSFFVLTLSGSVGTFLAGDLFTLFLFFEFMSLPAYVLVVHEETPAAMRAGLKYLFMTIAGSLAFFFGLVATFELGGTVSLDRIGVITQSSPLSLFTFIAFVAAFGMKAGMVPLHVWLSDAHPVAPSPASALLSGIMLKTGAYGLLRVIYNIYGVGFFRAVGWASGMLFAAAVTIILGSAVAITQMDIKRRLAYSSIGQMGYILLGMSLLSERALTGDIFHIFAHAIMKSCLFLCAGAIIKKTGKRDIREFGGLGQRMPVTMACFTVAALTMIGIPPLNGFISKWELSLGAFEAGKPFYAVLLIVSSLMNAVYYLPIVITAFFTRAGDRAAGYAAPDAHARHVGVSTGIVAGFVAGDQTEPSPAPAGLSRLLSSVAEAPPAMLVPIVVLALGCVVFSLSPANWPLHMSELSAKLLLGP